MTNKSFNVLVVTAVVLSFLGLGCQIWQFFVPALNPTDPIVDNSSTTWKQYHADKGTLVINDENYAELTDINVKVKSDSVIYFSYNEDNKLKAYQYLCQGIDNGEGSYMKVLSDGSLYTMYRLDSIMCGELSRKSNDDNDTTLFFFNIKTIQN